MFLTVHVLWLMHQQAFGLVNNTQILAQALMHTMQFGNDC